MFGKNLGKAWKTASQAFLGTLVRGVPLEAYFDGRSKGTGEGTRVSKPIESAAYVFAAVQHFSRPIRGAALEFFDKPKGGEKIEDAEVEQFWQYPFRTRHGLGQFGEMVDLFVGLRGTEGQAFLIMDDSWLSFQSQELKNPLIVAREEQMQPVYAGEMFAGWVYRDANGRTHDFLPEQVINARRINPHDHESHEGIGPTEAAQEEVDAQVAAAKFAKRTMYSNGDQGQIIVGRSGIPTPEQREQILASLREKRMAATRGDVKDAFLTGDIEVQTPTLQSIGSDFSAQRQMDAKTIFNVFGLPTSLMESQASYSIGSASDLFRAMHNAIIPEAQDLARVISLVSEYWSGRRSLGEEVARGFRTAIESPIYACFSFDDHPVMVQTRMEQIQMASTNLFGRGWSWADVDEYFGLGLPEMEGKDVAYLPFGLAPVMGDAPIDPEDPADGAGEEPDDPAAAALQSLREFREVKRQRARDREEEERQRAEEAKKEKWERLDRRRAPMRKRLYNGLSRALMDARSETLKNLKNLETDQSRTIEDLHTRAGVLEIVFDLNKFKTAIVAIVRSVLGDSWKDSAQETFDELDVDPSDDQVMMVEENPKVLELLRDRENLMRGISDEIHGQILEQIEQGVAAGESIDKIAGRIRSTFNDIDKHRARTIAVTETAVAYEGARIETFRAAGVTAKGWMSSMDDRVRDSHEAADVRYSEGIPLDEPFQVGAARLQYPGDPVGGRGYPEEVINCRCVLEAKY